jgi:hypothetical protein
MLWYYRPAWLTRARLAAASASCGVPVWGLLTAYQVPSRRPEQQRVKYQCEDQRSALNTMVSTMGATVNVHNDQAIQAARRLIPPLPQPWSLVCVLTTPSYGTNVSQALRRPCEVASYGSSVPARG